MPGLAAILLSRTAIEAYLVLAAALVLFGLKSSYDERRRDEARAEFAPVMTACDTSLQAKSIKACTAAITQAAADLAQAKANGALLERRIGEQNDAIQRQAAAIAKAKAASAAANKQADDDAAFYAERLKGLRQNLEHPSGDPNADADRLLRDLARRLRGH